MVTEPPKGGECGTADGAAKPCDSCDSATIAGAVIRASQSRESRKRAAFRARARVEGSSEK